LIPLKNAQHRTRQDAVATQTTALKGPDKMEDLEVIKEQLAQLGGQYLFLESRLHATEKLLWATLQVLHKQGGPKM